MRWSFALFLALPVSQLCRGASVGPPAPVLLSSSEQPLQKDCLTKARSAVTEDERHHVAPYVRFVEQLESFDGGEKETARIVKSAKLLAAAELGDHAIAEGAMNFGILHELMHNCTLARTGEELLPSLIRLDLSRAAEELQAFFSPLYLLSWRAQDGSKDTLLHIAARLNTAKAVTFLANKLRASVLKLAYKPNNRDETPLQAAQNDVKDQLTKIVLVYKTPLDRAAIRNRLAKNVNQAKRVAKRPDGNNAVVV